LRVLDEKKVEEIKKKMAEYNMNNYFAKRKHLLVLRHSRYQRDIKPKREAIKQSLQEAGIPIRPVGRPRKEPKAEPEPTPESV